MVRVACSLMVVLFGMIYVVQGCQNVHDCPCGQVCNANACAEGCMVFDKFMAPGTEGEIYGRKCECGTELDAEGRMIKCANGVDFVGTPEGGKMHIKNSQCTPK